MKTQTYNLTNENVTLTSYILDSSNEMKYREIRPSLLLLPGGGYSFCSDREAEPIAMHFLAMGINVFILRYSLKENSKFPRPLDDADEAMKFIIDNAEEFHVDSGKIAVCGFSAGGHLAAALGTMGKIRPAAMILGYPCITEDICNSPVLSNPVPTLDDKVDDKTPPAFIFAASDDGCVPIRSSLDMALSLSNHNIPFEMYIAEKGGHGFATGDYVTNQNGGKPELYDWIPMCKRWLQKRFFE